MFWRKWWLATSIGLLAAGATLWVFSRVLANPYEAPTPIFHWLANGLIIGPSAILALAGGVHELEALPIPLILGLGALINAAIWALLAAAVLAIARRVRRTDSRQHAT